jgi:hypothetical protein
MIHGGLIVPRRFVIPILLLFSYSISFADYHYASHTGSNTYPYSSWETAADSIQKAINSATLGDTIYVASGEFHEKVILNSNNLSLIGMGLDSTLIWWDNAQEVTVNVTSNMWYSEYIEGLHLQQREQFGCFGSGARWFIHFNHCRFSHSLFGIGGAATPMIVENCIFDSLNSDGVGEIFAAGANTIRNCLFWNVYSPIRFSGGPADSVTIRNCIFYQSQYGHFAINSFNNTDQVYNNLFLYRSDGVQIGISSSSPIVENNTFAQTPNVSWIIFESGRNLKVSNNAISNQPRSVRLYAPWDTAIVSYNNLWNSTLFGELPVEDVDTTCTLYTYPMFANPDSGDYHLQAYSPLIDAGDPNILDVDGTRSDIGCYGGPGGCSYIYLDLAPQIPDSISAQVAGDTVNIVWRRNYEADFNRYQIYRDTVSGFTPSIHNMIAEPETAFYQDIITNPYSSYYYKLTSVDNQHNASDFSDELAVIFSGIPPFSQDGLPRYAVISTAYPNPFNSQINIVYSASNLGPQPPEIKLEIFDIQGRVVRTLVNERKPCGTYRAIWDGKDDNGNPVASGSYLARVSQWGMSGGDFPIKITLVK